jgi:hypothetical protein
MKILKISLAAVVAFGLFSFTTSCNQIGNKNDKHMMDDIMDNSSMGEMMGENEEMGSQGQQDDFSLMLSSYLQIKDALVSDDSKTAQSAAKKMAEMESDIALLANAIAGSNDLMEQRKNFSKMSAVLYEKAKDRDIENTLYWNHCPMAIGGNGANWLSMNEEIRNPYMGQKMPGCGSVKETLNE